MVPEAINSVAKGIEQLELFMCFYSASGRVDMIVGSGLVHQSPFVLRLSESTLSQHAISFFFASPKSCKKLLHVPLHHPKTLKVSLMIDFLYLSTCVKDVLWKFHMILFQALGSYSWRLTNLWPRLDA